LTPGQTTKLSGVQHSGVLAGMALVAVITAVFAKSRFSSLRFWTIGGCLASAVSLTGLAFGASQENDGSGLVPPGGAVDTAVPGSG